MLISESPELSARQSDFVELAESVLDFLWTADTSGKIDYINKRCIDYIGAKDNQDAILHWIGSVHPDDMQETAIRWKKSIQQGTNFENQCRIKSWYGNYRWFLARAAPVLDKNSKIVRWIGNATDIEEYKIHEEKMKRNEALLRLIADVGVVLNSLLDYESTIQNLCEVLVPALSDWCIVDLVGDPDVPYSKIWHSDSEKLAELVDYQRRFRPDWKCISTPANVTRTGKSELYEFVSAEMVKKISLNEEHHEAVKKLNLKSVLAIPIVGSYGRHGALTLMISESHRHFSYLELAAAEDIGRRTGLALDKIILYRRERLAREQAEQANKSKSDFLANMSHEIRTPLNALVGFNHLLENESLSSETRQRYHKIIQRNSEHLLALIDDILDLSKVEAGHMKMEMLNVPVLKLLAEIVESLKPKAKEKNLELDIDINSNVPFQLVTDSVRLKQILTNVIGNAIKFTEKGWIKIFVNLDEKNQKLIFDVIDSGVGINSEAQKKLFQPFMQADTSITRKFGGTGLGLVLSKKLAQALGGDLCLSKSVEGEGSTFTIRISSKLAPALTHTQLKYNRQKSLKGVKVLVVDDSKDNQYLINQLLKRSEIEVEMADNGQIGHEKALSGCYDIVLMDVQMPVMDGLSATRQLREKNYKKPVIALTAHAMQDDRRKCLEVGCTDYLTKPVVAEHLIEMISRHLE